MTLTEPTVNGPTVERSSNGRPRPLPRRGGLPGPRAVVGGILCALAALGVFAAATATGNDSSSSFVVAARDLRAGDVLVPGDLELRAADLPGSLANRAFADPDAVVGSVVLAPMAEGELLQRSGVAEGDGRGPAHELSFAVDADRAVDGQLRPGETVDVLATYGTGIDSYTEAVVRQAVVVSAGPSEGGLGGRTVVLTLALDRPDQAMALAHAVRAGEITVVRSTGAAGDAAGSPSTYRPAQPADDD